MLLLRVGLDVFSSVAFPIQCGHGKEFNEELQGTQHII